MATMQLELVTAERVVYSDEVSSVVVPGMEGELGILPHHAALLTVLQPGDLRIRKDSEEMDIAVTGGFVEVLGNKVTVLADAAEEADEIDEERAREAIHRAEERLAHRTEDMDFERTLRSMRRAQVRLRVAQRRRRRSGSGFETQQQRPQQ